MDTGELLKSTGLKSQESRAKGQGPKARSQKPKPPTPTQLKTQGDDTTKYKQQY